MNNPRQKDEELALSLSKGGRMKCMVVRIIALLVAGVVATGCASNKPAAPATQPVVKDKKLVELNRWLRDVHVDVPPSTYRVQPPDAIRITAPVVKELDKHQAKLRPDGKVTLNLIGDVYVAGMSPAEIAQELAKRLKPYYRTESLHISVEVTEFASKKYYVMGQVFAPGVKPYTGRDTVVKVLADAVFNQDAWPEKVVLVRPHENPGIRQKITIDVKKMYETGSTDQNFLLEEGDLVYIPTSPLAEFRITTERLLAPIRPVTDLAIMGMGL